MVDRRRISISVRSNVILVFTILQNPTMYVSSYYEPGVAFPIYAYVETLTDTVILCTS